MWFNPCSNNFLNPPVFVQRKIWRDVFYSFKVLWILLILSFNLANIKTNIKLLMGLLSFLTYLVLVWVVLKIRKSLPSRKLNGRMLFFYVTALQLSIFFFWKGGALSAKRSKLKLGSCGHVTHISNVYDSPPHRSFPGQAIYIPPGNHPGLATSRDCKPSTHIWSLQYRDNTDIMSAFK